MSESKKTAMARHYHPLLHTLRGNRLHFVLISLRSDIWQQSEQILQQLKKLNMDNSLCAYYIFGDVDLLLRIWCTVKEAKEFEHYLSANEYVRHFQSCLIEITSPWYQEKIAEKQKNKKFTIDHRIIDSVMSGNSKEPFALDSQIRREDHQRYRFWIFIEEPFAGSSNIHERILPDLEKHKSRWSKDGVYKLSVYSYNAAKARGVIIKADAVNFVGSCDTISKNLHKMLGDSDYRCSTYIARERLCDESDELLPVAAPVANTVRKRSILENLLSSHDCHKLMWAKHSEEDNLFDSYIETISPLFYEIFTHKGDWEANIRKLRLTLKWVVERKNPTLMSFFLREHVNIERTLRRLLEFSFRKEPGEFNGYNSTLKRLKGQFKEAPELVEQIMKVLEKDKFPQKPTLGEAPAVLARLAKRTDVSDLENARIKKISGLIAQLSDDRNKLAHGELRSMFDRDGESESWPWERYTVNFFSLLFELQECEQMLHRIAALEKVEKKKVAEAEIS